MNILTIFAHSDDAEIWAGGTIIKHSKRGDNVSICTFIESGSLRIAEANAGAELLGAKINIIDRKILFNRELLVIELEKMIQEFLPSIIITHWNDDTHYEHRLVQDIVMQAIISPKITTSYPRILLSCDTFNSLGVRKMFSPNFLSI
ncbi:MAG: LmbE family protein [Candidatus Magnetoglobus multicellularis str. Araruama]|uniref:LmbE family protein n=1 Tax=Candidatus Magnetoglobus multicellularis str. Araruama TaxID=890399 RepID=A0A1V1P600_9BACT|nr:MAG: LmbE family protein [Candidatus Magnetoglobus multicellularis str. Araruama]